jgi:hypothetical protein
VNHIDSLIALMREEKEIALADEEYARAAAFRDAERTLTEKSREADRD